MDDINNILSQGVLINNDAPLTAFIYKAAETCRENQKDLSEVGLSFGECLAATFDLVISGVYAEKVGNNGWVFCRNNKDGKNPVLLYPFVNACPRCSARNEFIFIPSKKPESAVIGRNTSLILATIFQYLSKMNVGDTCKVFTLKGSGIVDAFIRQDDKVCLLVTTQV